MSIDTNLNDEVINPLQSSDVVNMDDVLIPSETPIPSKRYQARVTGSKHGVSSKGNSMVTLDCEIIGQDGNDFVMTYDNKKLPVVGLEFKLWLTYIKASDGKSGSMGYIAALNKKLGIDMPQINVRTPEHKCYVGKEFDIVLNSEPIIMREAANKAAGETVGKEILDGSGKQIITGYAIRAQLQNVIGLASFQSAKDSAAIAAA